MGAEERDLLSMGGQVDNKRLSCGRVEDVVNSKHAQVLFSGVGDNCSDNTVFTEDSTAFKEIAKSPWSRARASLEKAVRRRKADRRNIFRIESCSRNPATRSCSECVFILPPRLMIG